MRSRLAISTAVVTVLTAPAVAWAQQRPVAYGDWPSAHMMSGAGMGVMMMFGSLVMLAFLAVLVWVVVYATRRSAGPAPSLGTTPLEILRARFARGEIDQAEFEERRRLLAD